MDTRDFVCFGVLVFFMNLYFNKTSEKNMIEEKIFAHSCKNPEKCILILSFFF